MDGITRDDIKQGILGDCWFLSSCAAVSQQDVFMNKVSQKNEFITRVFKMDVLESMYTTKYTSARMLFTPQPLRAVGVLFSPMVSRWAGGRAAGKSLSGLYLRNRKV